MKFPDIDAWFDRIINWMRSRSKRFDHFWRAQERFFDVHAGLFSAAVSYYAFFAALSLSLLALSVLGYLLNFETLYNEVKQWLDTYLPVIDIESIKASRQTIGVVALVALVITGVNWVQAIRSSIRGIWLLNQQPGHPILRWILDLFVLFALGILLVATLAVTAIAEVALKWIDDGTSGFLSTTTVKLGSLAIGLTVNTILAAALLSALPRLALPAKRLLLPALWVAIGLEGLKTVGTTYITYAESKPAYQAVGTAVGLLLFLYLFNQILLFAAAWTATSSRGKPVDLVDRKPIETSNN